jgi:hypothetical protein
VTKEENVICIGEDDAGKTLIFTITTKKLRLE